MNKYEQIAEDVLQLIESGTLRPGSSIPSVRQMSLQKKVSIATVLKAYDLLESRGLIEARPRSGYFVRTSLPFSPPEPVISAPDPDPTKVSMRVLVEMVMQDTLNDNLVQLGVAYPNPALSAVSKLNRLLASESRRMGDASGTYEQVAGYKVLREKIAHLAVTAGCRLSADDIVITAGCTEAISLCLRSVCRPGDTVAIESPIFFDTLQALESLGLKALEIPTHPRTGISLDALRFAIHSTPVHACMMIPNYSNPLGCCMPDDHKRSLVGLLGKHGIPLIENDVLGEIHQQEQRPVAAKAYDENGMVMLCSSFSKTLGPGFRVGWVAPGKFKSTLKWHKFTSSLTTATLPQRAIAEFLNGGSYRHTLRRNRQVYARNLTLMRQAVIRYFPKEIRVTRPSGGFMLWIELPETVDSLEVYRQALKSGIALTPGHLFSATGQYRNFIRLNAASWSEGEENAVRNLGELIEELAGIV